MLLLDAAFDLLGTEGASATTVRAVCAAAQLNPRYFYESFADLDALLVAVYDRLGAELAEAVRKAVADADARPEAQVRAMVASTVGFVDEDRRRGRIRYREALGNEALNKRRIEAGFAVADLVAGGSRAGVKRLVATFAVGGFTEVLGAWLDGRIPLSRTKLIDHATQLFLAIGR